MVEKCIIFTYLQKNKRITVMPDFRINYNSFEKSSKFILVFESLLLKEG